MTERLLDTAKGVEKAAATGPFWIAGQGDEAEARMMIERAIAAARSKA